MLAEDILDDAIEAYAGKDMDAEEWDLDALRWTCRACSASTRRLRQPRFHRQECQEIRDALWERIVKKYDAKETASAPT
jgi:preprotein translocase subunit SecA